MRKYYYCLHFMDEKTKKENSVTCPRSQNQRMEAPDLNPIPAAGPCKITIIIFNSFLFIIFKSNKIATQCHIAS